MEEHICWILENPTDFYGILQVERDADDAVIRKKYYTLALKMHPDKNGGNAQASEAFRLVRHAYDTLSDPQKRSVYSYLGAKGVQEYESNQLVHISFWSICSIVLIAIVLLCGECAARVEHQTEVFHNRLMELFNEKGNVERHFNLNTFEHKNEAARAVSRKSGKRLFYAMTLVVVLCIAMSSSITYYAARDEWRREHVLFAEGQGWFSSPYVFTYDLKNSKLQSRSVETHTYCSEFRSFSVINEHACNDISSCAKHELNNTVWRVHQYYGTSDDAINALDAYLEMRCLTEMELWHASLQRSNMSSLLPLGQSPTSSESQFATYEEINKYYAKIHKDMIDDEVNSSVHLNSIIQEEGVDNVSITNTSNCNNIQNCNNISGSNMDVIKLRCKNGNHRQSKCNDAKSRCKGHHNNRCSNKANKKSK